MPRALTQLVTMPCTCCSVCPLWASLQHRVDFALGPAFCPGHQSLRLSSSGTLSLASRFDAGSPLARGKMRVLHGPDYPNVVSCIFPHPFLHDAPARTPFHFLLICSVVFSVGHKWFETYTKYCLAFKLAIGIKLFVRLSQCSHFLE